MTPHIQKCYNPYHLISSAVVYCQRNSFDEKRFLFTGSSHKQLFEKQLESGLLTDVKCTELAEIRHVFVLLNEAMMDTFEAAEQLFLACDKDKDGYISR